MKINKTQAEFLKGIVGGSVGAFVFFMAQVLVYDPIEPQTDQLATQYLPADLGQKSVLWLEERDGVLHLNWEKHARLHSPDVQMPTLACPVDGQCNSMTVVSVD